MPKRTDSSAESFWIATAAGKPFEILLVESGRVPICGVDEAGRGPLAGPVVAAALIFRDCDVLWQARDSKALSCRKRDEYFQRISDSLPFSIGICSAEEIDSLNILRASLLAMQRAIFALSIQPGFVLVDGIYLPSVAAEARAIPQGDVRIASISAASIVAKVHRDRLMMAYDEMYPGYGFARHKGYPTAEHRAALERLGPCPIHRRTFKGVREYFRETV